VKTFDIEIGVEDYIEKVLDLSGLSVLLTTSDENGEVYPATTFFVNAEHSDGPSGPWRTFATPAQPLFASGLPTDDGVTIRLGASVRNERLLGSEVVSSRLLKDQYMYHIPLRRPREISVVCRDRTERPVTDVVTTYEPTRVFVLDAYLTPRRALLQKRQAPEIPFEGVCSSRAIVPITPEDGLYSVLFYSNVGSVLTVLSTAGAAQIRVDAMAEKGDPLEVTMSLDDCILGRVTAGVDRRGKVGAIIRLLCTNGQAYVGNTWGDGHFVFRVNAEDHPVVRLSAIQGERETDGVTHPAVGVMHELKG
jgi:hypothetical protein